MAIWIIPLLIVNLLLVWVTVASIRKTTRLTALTTGRDQISESVEEHPFTLNPIIWIILIATIFISIVIFYYAAGMG